MMLAFKPINNKRPCRRKPYVYTEHKEQVNFVKWFKLQYPKIVIHSIPNGGRRTQMQGKRLKAEGMLAGAPDIFIAHVRFDIHGGGSYGGLYIEMKEESERDTKNGGLSDSQVRVIKQLRESGYKVDVCYNAEEARLCASIYILGVT